MIDFAQFCALTNYDKRTFRFELRKKFRRRWRLVHYKHPSMTNDWTTFAEISDERNSTTIFAVRGTRGSLDMLQDINIWSPAAIMQAACVIGPDLRLAVSRAVMLISTARGKDWFTKSYYENLLTHVKSRVRADPQRRFYITGHSLGGGLAQLVALEVGIVAVTFSSPGLRNTAYMLKTNQQVETLLDRANRLLYSVVPQSDWVAEVDTRLGSSMMVDCQKPSFLECHKLTTTIDTLYCSGCEAREYFQRTAKPGCSS